MAVYTSRVRLGRTGLVAVLLGVVASACSRDVPDALVAAVAPPPHVEFGDCQASTLAPASCTLRRDTTVRLWIAGGGAPSVQVDGAPALGHLSPSLDGVGWTAAIHVPTGATELTVQLDPLGAPWTLALVPASATVTVDAIEASLRGDEHARPLAVEQALQQLDDAMSHMSEYERVAAGRLAMLVLQDRGDLGSAIEAGQRALDTALRAGYRGEAIEVAQILVYLNGRTGALAQEQILLDLQNSYLPLVGDALQRARWHYYRGVHASTRGDLGIALEQLELAERSSRRLGAVDDELAAAAMRAPLLALTGQHAERNRVVERILGATALRQGAVRCEDARVLSNVGWALLLAGGASRAAAVPLLERALAQQTGVECAVGDNPDRGRALQETRLNLALAALLSGDREAAERHLGRIELAATTSGQRQWIDYGRAELALAQGDATTASRLTASLGEVEDPLLAWQAQVLHGRALEAQGHDTLALKAFLGAENLLDQVITRLAVDQGREGLAAGMHAGAAHAIRLQLRAHDAVGAASTARRSRGRVVRPIARDVAAASLTDADRTRWSDAMGRYREASRSIESELHDLWQQPQDRRDEVLARHTEQRREMAKDLDLAFALVGAAKTTVGAATSPSGDVLWLLFHPTPDGWAGFAMDAHGVSGVELGALSGDDLARSADQRLLVPFAGAIDRAGPIHVLALGETEGVAFATLPWHDEPLISKHAIAHSLDLGGLPVQASRGQGETAVIVADPALRGSAVGRLAHAAQEGADVAAVLGARGWSVEILRGDVADHERVVEALGRSAWFHYAGHGVAAAGWESALALAGESRLGVRDILALPRVPQVVVLSGCRTGTVDLRAGAGGQHLAGAFLLAGAGFVIATSADIDDADAAAFATALYAAMPAAGEPVDGTTLFRDAMLQLRDPTSGGLGRWQHLRAWIP